MTRQRAGLALGNGLNAAAVRTLADGGGEVAATRARIRDRPDTGRPHQARRVRPTAALSSRTSEPASGIA